MPRFGIAFVGALSLTAASLICVRPSAAQTAAEPIAWTYRAPRECPSAEAFEAAFRARTQRAALVSEEVATARTFAVTVSSEPGRAVGRIEIVGPERARSTRVIAGHTCAGVVSALALVAALAVDPLAGEPAPPPPVPVSAPARPSPPLPVRKAAPPSRVVVASGLDGAAVLGIFPKPAPSLTTFAEMGLERDSVLSPSLRLSLSAAVSSRVPAPPGSAHFRWMAATLDACPLELRLTPRLRATPCALFELGILAGSGDGVPIPQAATRRWIAAGGSARLRWRFAGSFFAEAHGRLQAPLARDTFVFALPQRVVVHAVPAIVGSFGVGLGVRWP